MDPSPESASDPAATQPAGDQVGPLPPEVLRRSEHSAGHLRETAAALFLNASLGHVLKVVDTRLSRNRCIVYT
jgi:hypothetical protein